MPYKTNSPQNMNAKKLSFLAMYFLGKNHIWYWIKNGWGILGQ